MIIRDQPRLWQLFFILRGSIVPKIWPQILAVACLAGVVTAMQARGLLHSQPIAALPFSLIGIALSILAGFRNSASYERWWEARRILGQLVIETQSLSRQALAYLPTEAAERVTRGAIAFAHTLRCHLRDEAPDAEALRYRPAALPQASFGPQTVATVLTREIADALRTGLLAAPVAQMMEERVVGLTATLAGTERIRQTPMPYAYSLLLHRTAYLFCCLLPFGLAESTGAWTPLLAAIVAYTFFGLDALGDELAAPFGTESNALPLTAIARTIEIGILAQMGEASLPDVPKPENFVLR